MSETEEAARRPSSTSAFALHLVGLPVVGAILGVVVGIVGLRVLEPQHVAVALIAPVQSPAMPSSGVFASGGVRTQTPAPSAIEGGDVGPRSAFSRLVEILSSGAVAEDLARDSALLARVFDDRRDGARDRGGSGLGMHDHAAGLAAWIIARPLGAGSDADVLRDHLRSRLRIEVVGTTGLRRASYRHGSPDVAEAVLAEAIRAADGGLRRRAQAQSEALAGHLRQRLIDGVPNADRRLAISLALEEQERLLVLYAAGLPHAGEIVAGPTAPRRPDHPDPVVVLTASTLAGFAIGLIAMQFTMRRFA
jgi:hypothetical protein